MKLRVIKSSAFLTTLLTIVFLVVALSTATFAWFSANNVVNVSTISFIAQTRDKGAAPGDLQIAWNPSPQSDSFLIDFAQPGDSDIRLMPIMPLEAPVIGATRAVNALGANIFEQSFTSGVQENGVYIYDGFLYDPINSDVMPYRCVGRQIGQDDFYLINKNINLGQEVTVEYSITGDLADKLCIAIFVDDTLQYILSNTTQVYYGNIVKNTPVTATRHVDNLVTLSRENKIYIPPDSSVRVTMYAWYNGVIMNDNDVNKSSTLNQLMFKANPTIR